MSLFKNRKNTLAFFAFFFALGCNEMHKKLQ